MSLQRSSMARKPRFPPEPDDPARQANAERARPPTGAARRRKTRARRQRRRRCRRPRQAPERRESPHDCVAPKKAASRGCRTSSRAMPAATVDEVTADMSKDPRRERDDEDEPRDETRRRRRRDVAWWDPSFSSIWTGRCSPSRARRPAPEGRRSIARCGHLRARGRERRHPLRGGNGPRARAKADRADSAIADDDAIERVIASYLGHLETVLQTRRYRPIGDVVAAVAALRGRGRRRRRRHGERARGRAAQARLGRARVDVRSRHGRLRMRRGAARRDRAPRRGALRERQRGWTLRPRASSSSATRSTTSARPAPSARACRRRATRGGPSSSSKPRGADAIVSRCGDELVNAVWGWSEHARREARREETSGQEVAACGRAPAHESVSVAMRAPWTAACAFLVVACGPPPPDGPDASAGDGRRRRPPRRSPPEAARGPALGRRLGRGVPSGGVERTDAPARQRSSKPRCRVPLPRRHGLRGHDVLPRRRAPLPRHGARGHQQPRHLPRVRPPAALPHPPAPHRVLHRSLRVPERGRRPSDLDARLVQGPGDVRVEGQAALLRERVDGRVRGPRAHALPLRVGARPHQVQHRQLLHRARRWGPKGGFLFYSKDERIALRELARLDQSVPSGSHGRVHQRLRRSRHDGQRRRVGRQRRRAAREVALVRPQGRSMGARPQPVPPDDVQPRPRASRTTSSASAAAATPTARRPGRLRPEAMPAPAVEPHDYAPAPIVVSDAAGPSKTKFTRTGHAE